MTSSKQVSSEAHFKERASEYGVPNDLLRSLAAQGVKTMGSLAFSISRPGADFDENAFNDFARDLNGGSLPAMGALSALKRLHFESEVILTSTVRSSVETPESATPRPLPFAERTSRMEALRRKYTGINIHGVGEPSQSLIDEICHQFETRALRHVEAAKCTSRETEIHAGKTEKKIKLDSNSLAVKETSSTPDETVSTTYNLAQCLRRRGLAYDFAGLINFNVHEQYVEKLLRHLNIDPPPSYNATTLAQVLRADKEVFSYMAHNVTDIRPDEFGTRPLDTLLIDAMKDYNTTFHLLPLPKSAPADTYTHPQRFDRAPAAGSSNYGGNPWQSANQPSKGKSKGKGKGKGSNSAPRGFPGCVGRDGKNRPICFDFNVGECQRAPAGGTCNKGRHVCFKAGCFKTHSYKTVHGADTSKQTE